MHLNCVWVVSWEYNDTKSDLLRNFVESIVKELNRSFRECSEDIHNLCWIRVSVSVELAFLLILFRKEATLDFYIVFAWKFLGTWLWLHHGDKQYKIISLFSLGNSRLCVRGEVNLTPHPINSPVHTNCFSNASPVALLRWLMFLFLYGSGCTLVSLILFESTKYFCILCICSPDMIEMRWNIDADLDWRDRKSVV